MSLGDEAYAVGKSRDYFYVMKITNPKMYNEILKHSTPSFGYKCLLSEIEYLKSFIVEKYYENRDRLYDAIEQVGIERSRASNLITRCCGTTQELVYKTLVTLRKIKEIYEKNNTIPVWN